MLFIDPDPALDPAAAGALGQWLVAATGRGFAPDTVPAADALARLERVAYSVVVLGLTQAGPGGERLIEVLYARYPEVMFVAIADPATCADGPGASGIRPAGSRPEIATLLVPPFSADELAVAIDDAYELFERRRRHRATAFDRAQILLVEDSDGDAELVSDYLTEICGAVVTRMPRVEAAVQALAKHRFDFVISDLSLPDARGLDAVRRLQPLAPDTPLIVLTGLDDEVLALEAVKQGAQDYLVKGQIDALSLRRTLSHARERKRTWNRLREQTRHDPLTGAANRAALRERIEHALAKTQRAGGAFAVMFIDLDRFKSINDTYGHDAGDIVLCEVIERLRQSVRTSDMVARLGGDELAVFLDDLWPDSRPLEVAERILATVAQPIATGSRALSVTASIGLACYPDRAGTIGGTVDAILKAADAAMYRAKRSGRNNVQIDGAVSDSELAHRVLAGELSQAVEQGALSVRFQPQYTVDRHHRVDRQRIVAFAARMAWTRAGGATIADGALQALIDSAGCAVAAGHWLLEEACAHLARWRADGLPQLRVIVGLSARQLAEPGLVDHVRELIIHHGVPPACLELEITERALIADVPRATLVLGELRALGVGLAIAEFGSGYASLAYLSKLTIDCLKIDRGLLANLDSDGERAMVASAIAALGHHLGLAVAADGVDSADLLHLLIAAKCDLVQGDWLGPAVDAGKFGRPAAAPPAFPTLDAIDVETFDPARRTERIPCIPAA